MQAVIIAGGKGTRLRSRIGDLPKPLAPLGGRPLIDYQLELAARHGVTDVLLLSGYGAEALRAFCGDGSRWGVRIDYHHETTPLGTAGAVLDALAQLDERFIVLYGDTMLNVDLRRFFAAHRGADATLFVHPNDHPHDSDLVETDAGGRIVAFHAYPHPAGAWYQNLVNAAAYVLERKALERYRERFPSGDFAKGLFPLMLGDGARIAAYRSPEYIKDAGTPERLDRVAADLASGRIFGADLERGFPAVFLDRDGTLSVDTGFVRSPAGLELFPWSSDAVRRLNHAGVLAVLVTNQPVVARGEISEAELQVIHNKLETLLGAGLAHLDAIYYCPHHPHAGYPGERAELKIECACRKPKTGLIRRAAAELHIDLGRSWMVGDSTMDIQTAANAGIGSVLVESGNAGADLKYEAVPQARASNLAAAVDLILACLARGGKT